MDDQSVLNIRKINTIRTLKTVAESQICASWQSFARITMSCMPEAVAEIFSPGGVDELVLSKSAAPAPDGRERISARLLPNRRD